nr:hypothetical protein Iba_chr03eCG11430 [Ipomoea batatas]
MAHEDVSVDETGKPTADERPDPVDPVAGKVEADHCRPEGAGWVHRPAGEWTGGQNPLFTYEAAGDDFEEVASYNGAQELSNPVKEAGDDGDLAADCQPESDSGIDVAAGDVGGDRNRHKQSQSMANRNRHKPRRINNGGANAGEDEEQGGDELGEVGLQRGGAERIIKPSKSYSRHFDRRSSLTRRRLR